MKFDKWTVALAAVGMVSLASAAKAEEKPSTVLTGLSSTTLSGYVDTSAQWNLGTGNANLPPYKFGGASKADGFNLNVVQLRLEKPMDESEWASGYRVDMWMGPDANTLNTQSRSSASTSLGSGDFAIRQAYVALRTPVGNGIDWKMGVFDSIIGYESVESPNDPNYTRSYGHSMEPQTHTGLLASYRFCDMFSASAGVANTVGPAINSRAFTPYEPSNVAYAESYKTYMGSVAITAPDSFGSFAGSTLYGGVVNGFNNSALNTGYAAPTINGYVGATIATPIAGLRTGFAFDTISTKSTPTGNVQNSGDIYSIANYISYQATEKLSFHGRIERVSGDIDHGFSGISIGQPQNPGGAPITENKVYAFTATIQYDLWKNVLSRVEFRWDHIEHGYAFGESSTGAPDKADAFLIAANIIYKF